MSHEIDTTNDRVNMAAAHGVNVWWESEGFRPNRVDPSAPIEEWRAAALPFEIKKANVKYAVEIDNPPQSDFCKEMGIETNLPMNQERELEDGHQVLYRTDTGDYLSINCQQAVSLAHDRTSNACSGSRSRSRRLSNGDSRQPT